MNIFLCDSDKNILKFIESILNKKEFGINNITTFFNVEELSKEIENIKLDLLIINVDINGKSGIDFVKKNQNILKNAKIIYIVNEEKYIEKVFEENPFYILTTPITKEKLFNIFKKLIKNEKESVKYITVKQKKAKIKININDISYIESFGRIIAIHLENYQIINCYYRISDIEKELTKRFIRPHKSYIVNLDKIIKFSNKEIMLEEDITIPISRLKQKEIIKIINNYINEI